MTKTKNRKGKKKHAKHLDNVEARVSTIQHQKATLSAGIPAGGLDQYLKANGITPEPQKTVYEQVTGQDFAAVGPIQDSIEDAYEEPLSLVEDPATNGQDADFERSVFDRANKADRQRHLNDLSITDLRKYSKGSGIPGAYGLKKADLIEAIIAADWFAS